MKCDRTEIARTEATPVVSNRKLNLLYRRNTARFFVNRVICPLIRQRIHPVHLLLSERWHRRILNKHTVAVTLFYELSSDVILLVLLNTAGNRIFFFALADIFKGRTFRPSERGIPRVNRIASA